MKNLKRITFALSILIALLAVGGCERSEIGKTGKPLKVGERMGWEILCIDGVEYINRYYGYSGVLSVKFNPDSTVSTCDS